MNPKDFSWKEDQQVTVINPTDIDFRFKVHSKEYVVGAHQKAKMPGYIAWVYVHRMATKLALENDDFKHWNEEGFRAKYYDMVVQEIESQIQTIAAEPTQEAERFEEQPLEENSVDPEIKPMRRTRTKKTQE